MNRILIDRTLYDTKPTKDSRSDKEMLAYNLLEQLQIPFYRIDHGPAATIEDCEEIDALLGTELCKNLFLCNGSKTEFYLLLMPGKKRFITKDLAKVLGCSRLSFASPEYMEQFMKLTPGSVTILGLMFDTEHKIKVLLDREVADAEFLGCHPNANTSSLKVRTRDILDKFLLYTGHIPTIVNL